MTGIPAPARETRYAMKAAALPDSVRYVKLGAGGEWWPDAKAHGHIHAQWSTISADLLEHPDMQAIKAAIYDNPALRDSGAKTRDFQQLANLLDRPSQHVWITFQDGCLWWCTVADAVTTQSPRAESVTEREGPRPRQFGTPDR